MAGATFFQGPIILGLQPAVSWLGIVSWDFAFLGPGGACFALYRSSQGGVSDVLCFVFGFLKEERDVDVQIPMPRF